MTNDDDRELADRFAELRLEVARDVPAMDMHLDRVAPGGPRRRSTAPLLVAATAAAGIAILFLKETQDRSRQAPPGLRIDLGATHWSAPTDFLLATPGSEILTDVPTFGGAALNDWRGSPTSPSKPESHQ